MTGPEKPLPSDTPTLGTPPISRISPLWPFTFLLQGIVAGAAWWLLPHRFPAAHIKFWANQVALPVWAIAMGAGCFAALAKRTRWLAVMAWANSAWWIVFGVCAAVLFPASLMVRGSLAALLGVVAALAARSLGSVSHRARILAAVGGGLIALVLIVAQRGEAPGAHPASIQPLALESGMAETSWKPADDSVRLELGAARVSLSRGTHHMTIEPLLSFESRSPDRCWTLFARAEDRIGPPRTLIGTRHTPEHFEADFGQAEPARLEVSILPTEPPSSSSILVNGQVQLPRPVYSHLNSFATLYLYGHQKLEMEFSPCPGEWIEPLPHDFPVGRPLRLATMERDGTFRVVEAKSAEKGPFRTLAEGKLAAGDPLTVTLRDQGQPFAVLTFEDWSAQASTELSPTAGWGMPQNEIMFARASESPGSPVFLGLTLASTSTGRGFESVGHAAGVYRNRIRVTWLAPR